MPKSTPKSKPKASRSSVTREQLVKAAKLRDDGATWEQIRSATGAKLGSSGWFRAWEREEIDHRPAGAPKPHPEESEPAKPAKPKRTVRRGAKAAS